MAAEIKAKNEAHIIHRKKVEDVLLRRFFYVQSFEIYGGVGGLFDFGPPGCALKDNIIDMWRQHFVMTESMLEVSTVCTTPEPVLRTSGHVEKFTDFMVTDPQTGECFRADKLLEQKIDDLLSDPLKPVTPERKQELLVLRASADALTREELGAAMKSINVRNPGNDNNELTDPYAFNLMFKTSIGPTGKQTGFMRPETAQGIFVNFRRLLDYNNGQVPFGCAQIGLAFRNEIAPRSGLLRVREFPMMEIEHFVNPNDKSHTRFKNVKDVVLSLLDKKSQEEGVDTCEEMKIGDAVASGLVDNETLGYFMARTQLFLLKIGIKRPQLRFRQHLSTEMAHYACDCWDAEIKSTYGWIECVGHADRSAYDLKVHQAHTKKDLTAREDFKVPKQVTVPHAKLNNKAIGQAFGRNQAPFRNFFKNATEEQLLEVKAGLEANPDEYVVTTADGELKLNSNLVSVSLQKKNITGQKYIPSVIEPSFGLGRVLYSVLEHAYTEREGKRKDDSAEAYLALSKFVAPVKAGVLLQSPKQVYKDLAEDLTRILVDNSLTYRVDDSNVSLGRKYARADEIGIPFSIVIDIASAEDQKCTIRDRDSTEQVRVTFRKAADLIYELVKGRKTWAEVYASEEVFLRPVEDEQEESKTSNKKKGKKKN